MVVVTPKFLNFIRRIFGIKMQIGGLAILPFIFVPDERCKNDARLINHERIHLRQQMELLFFGFVIVYFIALYRKGYLGISFEREACSLSDFPSRQPHFFVDFELQFLRSSIHCKQ